MSRVTMFIGRNLDKHEKITSARKYTETNRDRNRLLKYFEGIATRRAHTYAHRTSSDPRISEERSQSLTHTVLQPRLEPRHFLYPSRLMSKGCCGDSSKHAAFIDRSEVGRVRHPDAFYIIVTVQSTLPYRHYPITEEISYRDRLRVFAESAK